jgi:hypothetical protein
MNTGGIGLGLFICKRLCETFNGTISIEKSRPNEGTTFCFTMLAQNPVLPESLSHDASLDSEAHIPLPLPAESQRELSPEFANH